MHPVYRNEKFTPEKITEITARHIETFKRQHPLWYPCAANANKLMEFLVSQIGSNEGQNPEYPYPYTAGNFQFAHDAILNNGGFFIERPESEEDIAAREQFDRDEETRIRQERINEQDTEARFVKSIKKMSDEGLRLVVATERPISGGTKYKSSAKPGDESRRLTADRVSPVAAARMRVSLHNPLVRRDSIEFHTLLQQELDKSS